MPAGACPQGNYPAPRGAFVMAGTLRAAFERLNIAPAPRTAPPKPAAHTENIRPRVRPTRYVDRKPPRDPQADFERLAINKRPPRYRGTVPQRTQVYSQAPTPDETHVFDGQKITLRYFRGEWKTSAFHLGHACWRFSGRNKNELLGELKESFARGYASRSRYHR
jgi:hypothetical protein